MPALIATIDRTTRSIKPLDALISTIASRLLPHSKAGACSGSECGQGPCTGPGGVIYHYEWEFSDGHWWCDCIYKWTDC